MVKVNESKPEDLLEHGPQSYLSIDESFVVLERTSQESNDEFASHMLQQPPVCPLVPPHGSYTGGLSRMEGQVSTILTQRFMLQGQLIVCYLNKDMNFRIWEPKVYPVGQHKNMTLDSPIIFFSAVSLQSAVGYIVLFLVMLCRVMSCHPSCLNQLTGSNITQ
jgi:hypothetical protein